MFFLFLFSCDVEVPTLEFENQGEGTLWQSGIQVDTGSEQEDSATENQEPSDSEGSRDSREPENQDTGE